MILNTPWVTPSLHPPLSNQVIHLWRTPLQASPTLLQQLTTILSSDEQEKAARFRFEKHQRRYTVARAMLRTILGGYLGLPPQELRFRYGPRGKPELADGLGDGNLRFNLAHSHELALYAFSQNREIGVDVEHLKPIPDAERIVSRFFSASEYEQLRQLPADQKQQGFFNGWTRKEAYIKALGDGLFHALDRFQVSLIPGEPVCLLQVEDKPSETTRWSLAAMTPIEGYTAALAVEGQHWTLHCFHLAQPLTTEMMT